MEESNCVSNVSSIEGIFMRESSFLDQIQSTLGPISNNSHTFIQDLLKAGETNPLFENDLNKLQVLNKSVESLCLEYLPLVERDKAMSEELRKNNEDLTKTQTVQESQLTELNSEIERLKSMLKKNKSYSASMGCVLSSMIWKVCKSEIVVEMFLEETRHLDDFLNLSNGTLLSFMEAVNYVLQDNDDSEEYKYVLGLCGTLANIAAHQKGRQSILELSNGLKYVHNAVHCISHLPMPNGRILMRLILLFLYNITINKKGSHFLHSYPSAIKSIYFGLSPANDDEIVNLTLNILLSLIGGTDNPEFIAAFKEIVFVEAVTDVMHATKSENVRKLATSLMEKLQSAKARSSVESSSALKTSFL